MKFSIKVTVQNKDFSSLNTVQLYFFNGNLAVLQNFSVFNCKNRMKIIVLCIQLGWQPIGCQFSCIQNPIFIQCIYLCVTLIYIYIYLPDFKEKVLDTSKTLSQLTYNGLVKVGTIEGLIIIISMETTVYVVVLVWCLGGKLKQI